ncbi:hypothetical protein SPE26_32395 [Bacillus thuringiensis]|uniref:Phage protein n=1 Tax=Bacillus thuringiensis TaxID=1428 RepID=A0AAW9GMH8_BACTU|nr:hypothetical protein [Bacillus thuringiensis]MDY0855508.1 hypothetical protein [Bacillus thuringiensis]MDY4395316.1 hypothetical protein [Bacillus thuringiensis]MDY7965551.1 hypothetical protein [Bacillus thuringiensis]
MIKYSKITLSNGDSYIVPIQSSILLKNEFIVNKDGEIYNKFILVPQIDLETEKKMYVTLNPQHIVTIEEISIKLQNSIPSIFRIEKIIQD